MLHDCKCVYDSLLPSQTVTGFPSHFDYSTSLLALGWCSPHFSIEPFVFKSKLCNHSVTNFISLRGFLNFYEKYLDLNLFGL